MRIPIQALCLTVLLALPAAVRAVFQDEAGHIDYHIELLGVPPRETTFFHRPRREDKASLLYTLSDLGVLGAVNPSSGTIVWRQLLADNITNGGGHLRAPEDATWVTSALGRSVQAWDAASGRNIWSLDFNGEVKDLEIMELTEAGRKDVLVLFEEKGATVARRIHGTEGHVVWEFRYVTSDIPLQVSTNLEKIFVVSLHGSVLSYSLKVTVLDTLTGQRLDEINIGTKGEVQKEEDVMFVGANSAAPIVAWTDNTLTKLKVNVLGTKGKQEFPLIADATSLEIHAPRSPQSQPHFLVQTRAKTTNKGEVYHIDLKSNTITRAYELPLIEGQSAFSTSSSGTNVYFTRVTPDEVTVTSSLSHGVLSRWSLKNNGPRVGFLHAVSEVVKKADENYAVRSAVVTDEGDWVMIRGEEVAWSRPEGLSGVVAATWAEIPESEDLAKTLEAEAHSNPFKAYIHRVKRHISELQYFPAFLQALPRRLLSSILGTDIVKPRPGLSRDSFGLNKLVVVATKRGKLYGLDAGNHGRILWSKSAKETPSTNPWNVKAIHADDAKGFVTVRGADGEFIIVRPDTGKTVETMGPGLWPPVQSVAVVDSASGPWLLPVGVEGKIGELPIGHAPKQTVVVRSATNELKGVNFEPKGDNAVEVPAWTFTPLAGQKIVDIASRPARDPIASIGRVLGDRSVKYKYLNPNIMVVAAIDEKASLLTTYLLDSVSGQVLATSTYEGVDPSKDIACALEENWFVCSFFGQYILADAQTQSLKGYQLAVSDLYESEFSNDRGPLGDSANFSSLNPVDLPTGGAPLPTIVSKTFVLSAPISALAVTQTRQGITARQLLAYAPEAHSILGLPRLVIEPRRLVGRDPTPAEAEEGLTKYAPMIELDPKAIITHQRDVIGVKKIITSPANLESTSLVFVYGIDIFGTRVTPSMAFDILDKGFNKVSVLLTILALTVGTLALRPMVRKNQINMRWQAPM